MTDPIQKPATARGLDRFLRTGYLIHDVSRLRRALYDQRSRHLGITRSQWWLLFNLSRGDGQPRNQNELAQLLEMGNAAVGELLLRLEKGGFIRRRRMPDDRRSKHVQIADRGREVLEHMRLVAQTSNDAIMAGISADEQRLLNDLLSRMKRNLAEQIQLNELEPKRSGEPPGDGDEARTAGPSTTSAHRQDAVALGNR